MTDAVAAFNAALDAVADTQMWSLSSEQLALVLPALHRAGARLAELELRVVAQATKDGVGTEVGAADTDGWWANATRQTRRDVRLRSRVAAALDKHPLTRGALAVGHVAEDQATVILGVVDDLPDDVDAAVVELAEKELVRLAEHHDALDLRRLGKRILAVVALEVGEEQERKALEDEAKKAAQGCRFSIVDDGNGMCHGRFTMPSATGAALKKSVMAYAAPKHRAANGLQRLDLPGPHRMGQAFCEYVERYPTESLPNAGGVNAAVVVTMTLETLLGGTQIASLDTGQPITASAARKFACEAGIIPVVLGGKSQPLDVGRARRFHTPPQRTAIALRDRTCTADGCDWPPAMCHVHHDEPWSKGGSTNVDKGRLLCPRHHSYAHNPKYRMKAIKNGRVVFARC